MELSMCHASVSLYSQQVGRRVILGYDFGFKLSLPTIYYRADFPGAVFRACAGK
jgi:hypothetical protein